MNIPYIIWNAILVLWLIISYFIFFTDVGIPEYLISTVIVYIIIIGMTEALTRSVMNRILHLERGAGIEKYWVSVRPDFACRFLTRHNGVYDVWQFSWEIGESSDDLEGGEDGDSIFFYLAWSDADGEEWDDIKECKYDSYLVLELLPTEEEVNKKIIRQRIE